MDDRPNLDYEPGPVGASYSRVGPPPAPAPASPGQKSLSRLQHELSAELGTVGYRRRLKPKGKH